MAPFRKSSSKCSREKKESTDDNNNDSRTDENLLYVLRNREIEEQEDIIPRCERGSMNSRSPQKEQLQESPPPPPRRSPAFEVAFSTFESPTKAKSSNVRVVARIRPLGKMESQRGCEEVIFPVLPEQKSSPIRAITPSKGRPPSASLSSSSSPSGDMNNRTPNLSNTTTATKTSGAETDGSAVASRKRLSFIPSPKSARNPLRPKTESSSPSAFLLRRSQSLTAGKFNKKQFHFDAVLHPSASQKEVYERSVGEAVRKNIFRGYNTTIIAYGQTGSGKTYTMNGASKEKDLSTAAAAATKSFLAASKKIIQRVPVPRSVSHPSMMTDEIATTSTTTDGSPQGKSANLLSEEDGIIPRAVQDLFTGKKRHNSSSEVSITLSYLEIYNDEVRDLLSDPNKEGPQLQFRDHGAKGVVIQGLTTKSVHSLQDARDLMDFACERRTTSFTAMNSRSSRSHAICALNVMMKPLQTTSNNASTDKISGSISAKLTLVDLAGSERLKQSKVEGVQQQESININKDLFVLSKVVSALSDQSSRMPRTSSSSRSSLSSNSKVHVPYRDSKLTRILRDSIGGNCCTVMVACVSPADANLDESVNTLRYAERMRSITNSVKMNLSQALMTPVESAALRRENKALKRQLADLTDKLNSAQMKLNDVKECDDDQRRMHEIGFVRTLGKVSSRQESDNCKTKMPTSEPSPEQELPADSTHGQRISDLKKHLRDALEGTNEDNSSVTSGLTRDDYLGMPDLADVADDSTLSTSDTLGNGFESGRQSPSSEYLIDEDDEEINMKKAICDRLEEEIMALQMQRDDLSSSVEKSTANLNEMKKETEKQEDDLEIVRRTSKEEERKLLHLTREAEVHAATVSARETALSRLNEESKVMKRQVQLLNKERNSLFEQVETYLNLSDIGTELTSERKERERAEKNLEEMTKIMKSMKMERDAFRAEVASKDDSLPNLESRIKKMEEELVTLKSENKRLFDLNVALQSNVDGKENLTYTTPSTKPTESIEDQIIVSPRSGILRERKDSPLQPPRSGKKTPSPEADEGTDSAKSEQRAIRIHAAKMLFWANKATERRNSLRSTDESLQSDLASVQTPNKSPQPAEVELTPLPQSARKTTTPNRLPPSARKDQLPPRSGSVKRHGLPRPPADSSPVITSSSDPNICTLVSEPNEDGPEEAGTIAVSESTKSREMIDGGSSSGVISNLDTMDGSQTCICASSQFSGNSAHMEFFLPKLGLACNCNAARKQDTNTDDDPMALKNILRPWQVTFLESLSIESAAQLVRAHKHDAKHIAKMMKIWREERKMKPVKTKSCYVALHIWTRTAKVILRSVLQQRASGIMVIKQPSFLEVSLPNDGGSVSTLGQSAMEI